MIIAKEMVTFEVIGGIFRLREEGFVIVDFEGFSGHLIRVNVLGGDELVVTEL